MGTRQHAKTTLRVLPSFAIATAPTIGLSNRTAMASQWTDPTRQT
jgi:hypothetical protein